MRLYWEVAKRACQRQLAYRAANLNGLVTNICFGYLRAVVFVAVFQNQTTVAGYDVGQTITYTWLTQALIMVVALWNWWDVEQTIRTGDVVSDLAKPFSYLGFWLARDYGRAYYFVLFRAAPILLVGQLTYGVSWPTSPWTWLAFAISVVLAIATSFAWRFALNLSAFWTTDTRGLGNLATSVILVLSGFAVPLPFFPSAVRDVLTLLPFAGIIQVPCDVFLGRLAGPDLLLAVARQALWTIALLAGAQLLVGRATRRVVVQGG